MYVIVFVQSGGLLKWGDQTSELLSSHFSQTVKEKSLLWAYVGVF